MTWCFMKHILDDLIEDALYRVLDDKTVPRILEIFSILCLSKNPRLTYVFCGRIISDFPIQHAGGFWNTPPTCSYSVRRVRKWF